jgi:hypothetical protein
MNPISNWKYCYYALLSKPVCNRVIYRTIRRQRVSSILEVGVGDASRAERMIQVARKFSGSGSVRYTGIDGFEANPDSVLTLKECHRRLQYKTDVKVQLVPGDMYPSIHRIANSHSRTDLIVISAGYDAETLSNTLFYIPRMLHATSTVFLQVADDPFGKFEILFRLEIERRAKSQRSKAA